MQLNRLQNQFIDGLVSSQPEDDLILQLQDAKDELQNLQTRFAIYKNNYHGALIKTLANSYPVTERLLGKLCFRALAERYTYLFPSKNFSLNYYGAEFSQFVFSLQNETAPSNNEIAKLPYLADVINFEAAINRSLYGPNNSTFDFEAFARIDPENQANVIFKRAENSQLIYSLFPLDKIWEINHCEELSNEIIDLSHMPEKPYGFMLWRSGFDLRIKRLSIAEQALIQGVEQGRCLRQLFESPAEEIVSEEEQAKLTSALPELISLGCITGFAFR